MIYAQDVMNVFCGKQSYPVLCAWLPSDYLQMSEWELTQDMLVIYVFML